MKISKYYTPQFYYHYATAKLQVYKQLFSLKILLFVLSMVSVSVGYGRPAKFLNKVMNTAVESATATTVASAKTISAFLQAQAKTEQFEGGFQADRNDNGNWTSGRKGRGRLVGTNFGISAPLLANYLGHVPTMADMKNLTYEVAQNIYRKLYWAEIKGDEIKDPETAAQIYDSAVNMG